MITRTTTQAFEAKQAARVGINKRISDDDSRVGSYVVHTPPHNLGNNGSRIVANINQTKSNIPGYQIKSKIATVGLQQSPTLSPRKGSLGDQQQATATWSSQVSSSRADDPCSTKTTSMSTNYYNAKRCIDSLNSSLANSSPQIGTSLNSSPPKAIPRSMFVLKQQQTSPTKTNLLESKQNNMGDRLSSPAIQHPYTQKAFSQFIDETQSRTTTNAADNVDHSINKHEFFSTGDTWNGQQQQQQSQVSFRYQQNSHKSQTTNHYTRQRENGSNDGVKLTPRLPRGVSKIPHQVHAIENADGDTYQRPESKEYYWNNSDSKYLTFSKDQATSHFESLREELSGQKKEDKVCELEQEIQNTSLSTGIEKVSAPKPLERQSKFISSKIEDFHHLFDNDIQEHGRDGLCKSATNTASRQQPVCEAFIMTGQSMLKLSCNESETNNNNNRNNSAAKHSGNDMKLSIKSDEAKIKSLSLNKLDKRGDEEATSLSINDIGRHKIETDAYSQQQHTQKTNLSPDNKSEGAIGNNSINIKIETKSKSETTNTTASSKLEAPQSLNSIVMDQCGSTESSSIIDLETNTRSHDLQKTIELDKENKFAQQSKEMKPQKQENELSLKLEIGGKPQQVQQQQQLSTPTCNDRDSARRLAKRLYNLSGFKRSDVCHHLAKNNPFSQMVAEEYVNLFDFRSMKLDSALRKFLSKLHLNGETQERERMLSQFSQRYYDCNMDKFPNSAIVQTLVCALILLNTDLHGSHSKKRRSKLSLGAFIDGLNNSIDPVSECGVDNNLASTSSLALDGIHTTIAYTFPRHLLIDLYESIKKRPLKCSDDKCDMTSLEVELDKIYNQQVVGNRSNTLPTRRFVPGSNAPSSTLNANARRQFKQGLGKLNGTVSGCNLDDSETAIQFKSGYLNRKRIFEAHGKRTSKGRRGWRRVYIILQDLHLIMRLGINDDVKSESDASNERLVVRSRAQIITQSMKNTIKIHHTFAKRSASYTKREHVFHLRLADQSEFLMQANSELEMNSWIDNINFATACLSLPALPNAISNSKYQQQRRRIERPLLPAAYTKLSYWEQLINHEERLQRLKVELDEHLSEAPNTKNANKRFKTEFIEKIAYLKQEIERYNVYVDLMRKKSNSPEAIVLSKHPHIASLTPSDEMILSLPSFAPARASLSNMPKTSNIATSQ